jgi:hypothetical protein
MNQDSAGPGGFDWLHFVARSGVEGCRWAEQYRQFQLLEKLSTRSLLLLRCGDLPGGYALLEQMDEAMRGVAPRELAFRAVGERWYYGVLGYYFYCMNDGEQAERAMVQAHQAVAAAIGAQHFLLPLANHCHEFRLHRARIARNNSRWDEMRTHVEHARAMMAGAGPLCVLNDGTLVSISNICDFYSAIPELTEMERHSLSGLLDDALRLRGFEQFVNAMYRIPGFVIPYP